MEKSKTLPLTRSVSFKAVLQKGNRIQIPRLIRWQFKLEPEQVLKVEVAPEGAIGIREEFFARMNKDGRIKIPKLILELLEDAVETSLVGYALEVSLEPCS
ncbi:MAG: hypothetical protein QMD13_09455 [Candidatus Bathyarchaeia archaeon]|nr:hypothetical protein [Candidatus Bathyarchaeia archaeon]MDI6905689.1 hypothetical protein [Candidatus Bathyarchaeia archaeon]